MNYIKLQVIRVEQKIGSFFIAKMTPKTLHSLANRNLSRLKNLENGIQREIQVQKVNEIKDYLNTKDATFPNSIIIAIQGNPSDEQPAYRISSDGATLEILEKNDVANILDGQHRLYGFSKEEDTFELPVSIFLDLSLGEQAKIFAKINSTQKKVDLSLVYELFGITDGRTPEKVAFHIVSHLNSDEGSAWKGKVKTLSDSNGDLAQGSMAKYVHVNLINGDKVFKQLYDQERDTDIKNILMNYFNAIQAIFPEEWENNNKKYILTKTTGFNGFMSFLIILVRLANRNKEPLSIEYCSGYLKKVSNKFGTLTSEYYPSGATGQNKIRDILRGALSDDEKKFLSIK